MKLSVFWFRRDLRLLDNTALHHALSSNLPVLPLFIFDENILDELPKEDSRVSFIYNTLRSLNKQLSSFNTSLLCLKGDPVKVWKNLLSHYDVARVFINKDYEPYALQRDESVKSLLNQYGIPLHSFKDHVIFEENEIVKQDGSPYTIFTPYKKKWLQAYPSNSFAPLNEAKFNQFHTFTSPMPTLKELGFQSSSIKVRDYDLSHLQQYDSKRDYPAEDVTSYLSPHLRFGTVSIRKIIEDLQPEQEVFLSELIWREFFMQILFHFPQVVNQNFKPKYNGIQWRNNEQEFEKWCQGKTGYPLVDAGMRQLNTTGYMHNRVRMVTASFLCKHLLIDWRWGEAYFAKKLLDYELSSNNGNWQWAAGTGCDAAPYFRVFNPTEQLRKFDRSMQYTRKWVPEFDTPDYPSPIVEHKFARTRALESYKKGLIL
ncbi:MAG: deoxyribodipyrimidine photo-lyase [Marinifilaceae bacterium]